MTDETAVPADVISAQEQVVTAAPEPVVLSPDAAPVDSSSETPAETPPKTFTQEELDAVVGKRLAREQRKWEREQVLKAQMPSAPAGTPTPDQYETPEAYLDALATRKAQDMVEAQRVAREQSDADAAFYDRVEQAHDKYENFAQVVQNPNLAITEVMAQTIKASELGPDVAYYLGTNPEEATRISRLNPFLQAKEIGRIEATILATPPPVKKSTSAPAPINPVTARASGNPSYDTTDPRSVKSMSTSEWIEADRQRQIRKMQAQQTR
ncbi:MAG: hypothetical protein WC551_10965 [Patescibacteria group bacterium]